MGADKFNPQEIREIAVMASLDPRSVKTYLQDGHLRSGTKSRVQSAIIEFEFRRKNSNATVRSDYNSMTESIQSRHPAPIIIEWLRICDERNQAEKRALELEKTCDELRKQLLQSGQTLEKLTRERDATYKRISEATYKRIRSSEDSELLSRSVDELELSSRAHHSFDNHGIKTIGQLVRLRYTDLMGWKNVGRKTVREIKEKLATLGLKLRGQ